jgi:hypothetical protein
LIADCGKHLLRGVRITHIHVPGREVEQDLFR